MQCKTLATDPVVMPKTDDSTGGGNMKRMILATLVASFGFLIYTGIAHAELVRPFPQGISSSNATTAYSQVISRASVDGAYASAIASSAGASSFAASEYQVLGYGRVTGGANMGQDARSGAVVATRDTNACHIGAKALLIMNIKTQKTVEICVACGNTRLGIRSRNLPAHKWAKDTVLPFKKTAKVSKTIACPGTGQKVTGSVTVTVKGIVRGRTWGVVWGRMQAKQTVAINAKVIALLKLKCGPPPTPPTPPTPPPPPPAPPTQVSASASASASSSASVVCPNGTTASASASASASATAAGSTYLEAYNKALQQAQSQANSAAAASASASASANCGTTPPPVPPVTLVLSNLTNPQNGADGVYADGGLYPNICVTVQGKSGDTIKLTFGAAFGSFQTSIFTITSTGVDRFCQAVYKSPLDAAAAGKTETLSVSATDVTANVNSNTVTTSFVLNAPRPRP